MDWYLATLISEKMKTEKWEKQELKDCVNETELKVSHILTCVIILGSFRHLGNHECLLAFALLLSSLLFLFTVITYYMQG